MNQVPLKIVGVDNFKIKKMKTIIGLFLIISLACQNKAKTTNQQITNLETKESINQKIEVIKSIAINEIDTLKLVVGQIDYATCKAFIFVKDQQFVSKSMYLDAEVFEQFKKMQADAKKEGISLKIISGVRSFEDQKRIWERKWLDRKNIKDEKNRALDILKYSSMPMTSRHHWGTDIDINSLDNNYFNKGEGLKTYNWLTKNANLYGFHQVYTNKKETKRSGYEEEKWHWSYLPKAKKYLDFYNKNLTNADIKGFLGSEQAKKIAVILYYVNGITNK